MIRIAVCSAEGTPVTALESALRKDPGFGVTAFRGTTTDILVHVARHELDIVLFDVMNEVSYFAIRDLVLRAAEAKVVLRVDEVSTEMTIRAMQAGVRGVLRRGLPLDAQISYLARVYAGEPGFPRPAAELTAALAFPSLNVKESGLLALVSQGLKDWEIGESLGVSEGTVKIQLSRLFQKLGVKDRFELALLGLRTEAGPQRSWIARFYRQHRGTQYNNSTPGRLPAPVLN